MTIEQGDSELDRMLRDVFPHAGKAIPGKTRVHLPGFRERVTVRTGSDFSEGGSNSPSGSPGSPQTQPPVKVDTESISDFQEMLRHLQIHTEPPYHQEPPFDAVTFDVFSASVSLAGGGYGAGTFTKLVSYVVPEAFEGRLSFVGQQAETMAAYQDIQWRLRVDGIANTNYSGIKSRLFQMAPPGSVLWLPLKGGQTVDLFAASLSATTYNAFGRIMGYIWPARFSEGESATRSMF